MTTTTYSPDPTSTPLLERHRLLDLLPALYRVRDAELSFGSESVQGPLQVFLAVLEEQFARVEGDVRGLYDDWFIETCQPWLVPYLGDLLRVRGLHEKTLATANVRAFVANALEYRSRKGTVSAIAEIGRDVSGWPVRPREGFRQVILTQHVNHVLLSRPATLSVRNANSLELLGSAFENAQRTPEVRRVASGRGRYNLNEIALHVWRRRSYPLAKVAPSRPDTSSASIAAGFALYRFDSLGRDVPLFAGMASGDELDTAGELGFPVPLRRRALYEALRAETELPFSIFLGGLALDPVDIEVGDLAANATLLSPATPKKAVVDPVLGRFALRDDVPPEAVDVSYRYGFSAEMGGGPYARASIRSDVTPTKIEGGDAALDDALVAFGASADKAAFFEIHDSKRYSFKTFELPADKSVVITALNERRPTLELEASFELHLGKGSTFDLSGVVLVGPEFAIKVEGYAAFALSDATLGELAANGQSRPAQLSATAAKGSDGTTSASLKLELMRCIIGPIHLEPGTGPLESQLVLRDSIVHSVPVGGGTAAPAIVADTVVVHATTVIGRLEAKLLDASNALLSERVSVERVQDGCVRYSYVPDDSRTPRRHRCQPDLALLASPNEPRAHVLVRMRPVFASTRFGDPGYAELDVRTSNGLLRGADDESELGAFHHLYRPQCAENLEHGLSEYLPSGLEAGAILERQES